MPEADVQSLLEAARWAPSSFNLQPWRFVYARRQDEAWEAILSLLLPFNRLWACNASLLIFALSERFAAKRGNEESYSNSFDCGAAWANLALQAIMLDYHAHAMTGFDRESAYTTLNVPPEFRIEAAIAVGRRASPDKLPDQLREREVPSSRYPVTQIAFKGLFQP